jgi:hypothetical protein
VASITGTLLYMAVLYSHLNNFELQNIIALYTWSYDVIMSNYVEME